MGNLSIFPGTFYIPPKDRQPSDDILAALIGTSFRISSANMIFTSDILTNSGYIKPKNLVLSTTDSVTDYFKVSARVTFLDYFREMFYPFFHTRYPGMTEQRLIEHLSLAGLEEYLRHTTKIGLLHNADDIILGAGELDYLLKVFGPRAKIYPRGGHCGNLAHRSTLAYIVEFFRNPITANPAQIQAETRVLPQPVLIRFPQPQALAPEDSPASRVTTSNS